MEKHLFSPNQRRPDGKCILCRQLPEDHIIELVGPDPENVFSIGDTRDHVAFPHRSG